MEKIRVLVVDDSLVVRRVVTEELSAQADMEVVGSATNRVFTRMPGWLREMSAGTVS